MKKKEILKRLRELCLDPVCDPVECKPVRPVVVFTDKRGVFFGYTADTAVGNVKLSKARNCHYWEKQPSGRQHGFLGLASHGPADGSRISVAADVELTGVTCIAECTQEAAVKWEKSTWS